MAIDWDAQVLAPMMSQDVFGEAATYTPPGGAAFPVDVVFDRPYKGLVLAADGEPVIATREPVAGVRLVQFTTPPVKGGKLAVPSVPETYMVNDVQPDGKGWAKLMLTIAA